MELPAITDLSNSSQEHQSDEESSSAVRPCKRKRASLDDESSVRAVLGRRCLCKRWNCFEKFTREQDFRELLQFRRDWCKLHKLDQDRVVAC